MAQPTKTPINPTPPAPGPRPGAGSVTLPAAKRRREDYEGGGAVSTTTDGAPPGEAASKRQARQDIIFRIVVPSRQIGKVIGKEGSRIQKIREETRATIKIADAVVRHEERVIIISSGWKEDGDKSASMISDAENALQQIASLILKEDESSAEALKVGGGTGGHVAANTIRLLIAGSQAGSLIGMSGQNIEKLRNSSGAMITVLAPNQLPLCASAHESDRIVQISGDIPVVMKAIEDIGAQLRENPPRQVISISPAYNYCAVRPPQQYTQPYAQPYAQPYTQLYVEPAAADYVTMEMMISETLVGGLIGRSGSNISRIRNESGAMIKVYGGKGAQKHRHIQFGGSAQQVALAKQRVDEYIYSQLIQQGDPQQAQWNYVEHIHRLPTYDLLAPPLMHHRGHGRELRHWLASALGLQ